MADADVEGVIAGIGQRMLASIAKRVAADAMAGLDAAMVRAAPAEEQRPDAPPPDAPPAGPTRTQVGGAGQRAIERARRGIGLRGERAPTAGRPESPVPTGLVAGVGAAVAAIAVGVLLRRRRGRR
jgi:hypothetical protein